MKISSVVIALLFFCGCSANTNKAVGAGPVAIPTVTFSPIESDILSIEAKRRWDNERILDYDMTLSLETASFLEPARKVDVKVRKAKAVSVEVSDGNDKRGRLAFYAPYTTVEGMFVRIQDLRERSGSVSVKFDDIYGFPEEIEYSEPSLDASFTFKVLSFTPRADP